MAGKTTNKPTQANQQSGGANDFTIITSFKNGYRNREDITVLPPGVLVEGSENVLTNTHQRIGIRKGYTLDGQANTDLAPISSAYDWISSVGEEKHMRNGFLTDAGNDGKLQYRYEHEQTVGPYTAGEVEWVDLLTDLTTDHWNYTTFWSVDNELLQVLGVDGTPGIFQWYGGTAEVLSSTNDAGIISSIRNNPNETGSFTDVDNGGVDYIVGDILTVDAGDHNASLVVASVAPGAIKTSSINNAGTGYAPGDTISINGGGTAPFAHLTVLTVGGGGSVATYSILNNGIGYSVAAALTTISGTGTGFTVNITAVGNGVTYWAFHGDETHGTGYSAANNVPLTGGSGTGARLQIGSVTSGTLTIAGTKTIQEKGFLLDVSNTQQNPLAQLVIGGIVYSYDNTQSVFGNTTTFYGVSPDPSGIPAGTPIAQNPHLYVNGTDLLDGPTLLYNQNLISTIDNRIFLGSSSNPLFANPSPIGNLGSGATGSSVIFVSEVNNFLQYGPDTAGVVGAPFTIISTSPPTAFIQQEEFMYISAGHDEWYNVQFVVTTSTDQFENVYIQRLNTTPQQASQSQTVTGKIANSVIFLSFEPIIETFGRVDNILLTPQMTDYSYSIINLMNAYDFTDASIFYYRKFVYVAVPRESVVLVYNMTDVNNPYWEAPQRMPIARFSIIGGDLYGHSSQVSESYKLFDGTNDNGFPIAASATFSFNNYGTRTTSKGYNEFYVEGYISSNTTLQVGIQFDIDGCARQTFKEIIGSDTQIVCLASDSASLGKVPLGKNPLGGVLVPATTTPKFRVIKTFPLNYFYEDQISFSSTGIDQQWEVIAFGPQLVAFSDLNNKITQ